MEKFMLAFYAAIVIEALVSWGDVLFVQKKIQWKVLLALGIAAVIVYDFSLNLFAMLEITEKQPIIGVICTMIVLSRGASYLVELLKRITNWKQLIPNTTDNTKAA